MKSVWVGEYGSNYEGTYELKIFASKELAQKWEKEIYEYYNLTNKPQEYCVIFEEEIVFE